MLSKFHPPQSLFHLNMWVNEIDTTILEIFWIWKSFRLSEMNVFTGQSKREKSRNWEKKNFSILQKSQSYQSSQPKNSRLGECFYDSELRIRNSMQIKWNFVLQHNLWLYDLCWWRFLWITTNFYCAGDYFVWCVMADAAFCNKVFGKYARLP